MGNKKPNNQKPKHNNQTSEKQFIIKTPINNPTESKILEQFKNRSISSLSKEEKKEIQEELWLKFCELELYKWQQNEKYIWKSLLFGVGYSRSTQFLTRFQFAKENGMKYVEANSKTGKNVSNVIDGLLMLNYDQFIEQKFPKYSFFKQSSRYFKDYQILTIQKDFIDFYNKQEFCDFEIKTIKCHKLIVEIRTKQTIEDIEEILTNETIENIKLFFKWVYGNKLKISESNSICHIFEKINIQYNNQKFKNDFLNDLYNLYKDNKTKDFTIKIKNESSNKSSNESSNELSNETIKVHKTILLIRSELFRNMFKSIEEKNLKSIFDYSGKSYETLKCLINYFYTDQLIFSNNDDVTLICEELEDAIEYYQLNIESNLHKRIQKYLKKI
ncbi:speckle-type poz protein [Anaeramoeba flamelloides]|uniref:Speckle-type poz protein n=1 Tax=Anaeramoeba flamelloides TaxID=1746091 RepID=A0ABQ8XKW0_9EUKA|nr:speckle-type poz protein [Anaeramoeba flamelloides]